MVRPFLREFVRSCLIQFAVGSFYADCPHKRIIHCIMKVYNARNNIKVELIWLSKKISTLGSLENFKLDNNLWN